MNKRLNQKWERVTGPNLQPQHAERMEKNTTVLNSQAFKDACQAADIKPTRRQASKFRNGRGRAYQNR